MFFDPLLDIFVGGILLDILDKLQLAECCVQHRAAPITFKISLFGVFFVSLFETLNRQHQGTNDTTQLRCNKYGPNKRGNEAPTRLLWKVLVLKQQANCV